MGTRLHFYVDYDSTQGQQTDRKGKRNLRKGSLPSVKWIFRYYQPVVNDDYDYCRDDFNIGAA